jgi:hypothetical protein
VTHQRGQGDRIDPALQGVSDRCDKHGWAGKLAVPPVPVAAGRGFSLATSLTITPRSMGRRPKPLRGNCYQITEVEIIRRGISWSGFRDRPQRLRGHRKTSRLLHSYPLLKWGAYAFAYARAEPT